MADFNLLPSELAPKAAFVRFANILGKVALIAFTLYVFGIIGLGITIYNSNKTLTDLEQQEGDVKQSIQALEETEQKLILVKDRIAVSNQVENTPYTKNEITKFIDIYNAADEVANIREVEIQQGSLDFDITVADADAFAKTLELLSENDITNTVMSFLRYQSGGPYSIGLKSKVALDN